jgi:hypothetical protein
VARELAPVAELLAQQGLEQERRALRCAVRDLSVESEAAALTLSFTLGRGQFATAVLREICDLAEPAFVDSYLDYPAGRSMRRGVSGREVVGQKLLPFAARAKGNLESMDDEEYRIPPVRLQARALLGNAPS